MIFYVFLPFDNLTSKVFILGCAGSLLSVGRMHLYHLLDRRLTNIRFGTPIALLVKRFSAARVLPLLMIGFVSVFFKSIVVLPINRDTRVQCSWMSPYLYSLLVTKDPSRALFTGIAKTFSRMLLFQLFFCDAQNMIPSRNTCYTLVFRHF